MTDNRTLPSALASTLLPLTLALTVTGAALPACGDTYNTYIQEEVPTGGDAGALPEAGPELPPGTPTANTDIADHVVDVYGPAKHRYWFVTSDEQVERMNGGQFGGGNFGGGGFDDKYTPGGNSNSTYADHLFVTAADAGKTADYGKVQVRVMGQSSHRPWTPSTIPNLRVDTNEFTPDKRISNVEHLRFSNSQVGNIFRETVTYAVFRELGYPAPRTAYAWVGGNVWGPGVEIPYAVVEVYKKAFCKRMGDAWGGGCANLWEFAGDLSSAVADPSACQSGECDNGRLQEFADTVFATPQAPGFKDALSPYLDWPAFHRFHCLSWILDLGDGALHAGNNVVIAERDDGYFQYLPYSVDISAGFQDFSSVPLYGSDYVSFGCQADPACWADTITTCEATIAEFTALDPAGIAERVYIDVNGAGMLRPGDEERFSVLRDWYLTRVQELPGLLDQFRTGTVVCQDGWESCNGGCVPPGECFGGCGPVIDPGPPPFQAVGADAGAPAADIAIMVPPLCKAVNNYGL